MRKSLLTVEGKSASGIMGHPDDLKLRSSMTLFTSVSDDDGVFQCVLDKYYHGTMDQKTLELLS
jgi:uncharacterized protein (DUF1810 family)